MFWVPWVPGPPAAGLGRMVGAARASSATAAAVRPGAVRRARRRGMGLEMEGIYIYIYIYSLLHTLTFNIYLLILQSVIQYEVNH